MKPMPDSARNQQTVPLLPAVVYLKLKKCLFNEGTQIEAATKFNMKTKALGKLLLGKHY